MTYAVFSSWTTDPAIYDRIKGDEVLRAEIVPMLAATPGFLSGKWTTAVADPPKLLGYLEYATREQAADTIAMMSDPANEERNAQGGVNFDWAELVSVSASA
jgi:hypothetical protein